MAPACDVFPASELPSRVQEDLEGKRRKPAEGASRVDLDTCKFFQTLQYECEILEPSVRNSRVVCTAIPRFFRR